MSVFASVEPNAVIRVVLRDGTTVRGSYLHVGRKHFVTVPDPTHHLGTRIEGPFDEVETVEVIKTVEDVRAEVRLRSMGEPVLRREPRTRDDYEHGLRTLAKAAAKADADGNWKRAVEIRRQFDDIARRIGLAKGKREWVLREAKWSLTNNEPPRMKDIWCGDTAHPSFFQRPRPQDFDPDPAVRRKRVPTPEHVRRDPRSIPNMLSALKAAGLDARIHRLGDPPWDAGALLVKMPVKGRAQFVLWASRDAAGVMQWDESWDGNFSEAGRRRRRVVLDLPEYQDMMRIMKAGRDL